MSALAFIFRSLVFHRRLHAATALGVLAATAVLTGALLVGDSMRGSLRGLTLERLGRIDEVLLTDRLFRAALADELSAPPEFSKHFSAAMPVLLLEVSAENPESQPRHRAGQVHLIGCDERFWALDRSPPGTAATDRSLVLNEPLARRLGVAVGSRVLLELPRLTAIPSDSALGRKTETVESYALTVSAIIPAAGVGRFSLQPSQQEPLDAYVPLAWLARQLEQPGRANAILVAGQEADRVPPPESEALLAKWLRPELDDFGLQVVQTPLGYFDITSRRMILDPASEHELLRSLGPRPVQPALTYLANTIARGDREIPYSTVTAIDFADTPPLGPLRTPEGAAIGPLADNEIVLNAWVASELGAKPGDTVRLSWFEPETRDGQVREISGEFRVAAICALAGAADDPALTPEVPGVTDQTSMRDWNPPFPFDASRIRKQDEKYWDDHRATPKAFVALATGRRLWQSRFGQTTSLRVAPREGETLDVFRRSLVLDPAALGLRFQPVKRQGLAAAAGTTPFDVLFLLFSMFLILAAVLLIALLFRLGIEQRQREVGTLLALGFRRRRVVRLLAAEGLLVAAIGSLAGVLAGIGYAALMVLGLRTWWLAAIVTPFVELYVTPRSLLLGYLVGLLVSAVTIAWTVRRSLGRSVARLMAGGAEDGPQYRPSRWATLLVGGALAVALGIGLWAAQLGEDARAGAFFGAGALVLVASLGWIRSRLRAAATGAAVAVGRGNLLRLALRNAARHPGRSSLSIGLVAAACFLITSVSAFRLDPVGETPRRDSGNGGFALVAETARPIYQDLNRPEGRSELGFAPSAETLLEASRVFAFRVRAGDDASCLNLYRPRQPRILGVPPELVERGGFAWSAADSQTPAEQANPWLLLNRPLEPNHDGMPRVPVVLEKNTAMYALQLYQGVGQSLDVTDGQGHPLRLVVVALLDNGIFQGDLLIGSQAFLTYFPETNGYRFFLVETPPDKTNAVQTALEDALSDYGMSAETTGQRLARFLAVQNTYLSTFQSLGGLGLLLGTLGLAAVQLRNVAERRGELALLQAIGFRRRRLGGLVLLENGVLLLAGLATGLLAAGVAVLPHLLGGQALIPWASLGGLLLLVLATGLVASLLAVRAAVRAPVVATLRGE